MHLSVFIARHVQRERCITTLNLNQITREAAHLPVRYLIMHEEMNLYSDEERDIGPRYERSLMLRWVVGSILHGGPIELFIVPASYHTTGVPKAVVCVILYVG